MIPGIPEVRTRRGTLDIDFRWKLLQGPAQDPLQEPLPDPLTAWADRIAALWSYPLLRPLWARAALLAGIVAICAMRAWIGLAGVQQFSHDAFMPLDGAWRMLNGQVPHTDFYSFMGVAVYLPTLLGMLLAHGGAEGFGWAQAIVSAVLGCWAYAVARRRLDDVPAALYCLGLTLLAAAPFPLGYSPLGLSPATVYNRYGYALVALALLESFAPLKRDGRRGEAAGGVSTGAVLVLLFFLKATFFGAALFLVAALVPCRRQTRERWSGMLVGLAATALPFCLYLHFQLMPMLRDLALVAQAKRVHVRAYLWDSIAADAAVMLCFALFVALLLTVSNNRRAAKNILLLAVAASLAGAMLVLGDCEPHGWPLSLFFILIAASQTGFRMGGVGHLFRSAVLVWTLVFAAVAIAPGFVSFAYAGAMKVASRQETPLAGNLRGFVTASSESWYRDFVNDGMALLERNRAAGDTVMSLDFSNPFSFGLRMKPAPGGTTALHFQTTFNDSHRQTAEQLFGRARLVMVPRKFSDETLEESIPRLYGPYLASHFRVIGESAHWTLYRAAD